MTDRRRPRVLIEDWLPTVELGIESRRERAAASALPPLSFLHLWWARRPLVASAGSILASLMPAWSPELAAEFPDAEELEAEQSYRAWFLRICGIVGDPIAARKQLDAANALGIKLKGNGYGYKQAFRNSPSSSDLELLSRLFERTWGKTPHVVDPTAGGGSIPYEAVRYGLPAIANDLNPVAAVVLRAGVEIPARYGVNLTEDLRAWGEKLCQRISERLRPAFELEAADQRVVAYIFARTIVCPRTGKLVPLAPNWALRGGSKPAAARLVTERDGKELEEPEFEIARGSEIDFDPVRAPSRAAMASLPWMASRSTATTSKKKHKPAGWARSCTRLRSAPRLAATSRPPTKTDLAALELAARELDRLLPEWEAADVIRPRTSQRGTRRQKRSVTA